MKKIDIYAVMGNPVAHSKSPLIHQAFAQQTQQELQYHKILVPLDGFATAVAEFKENAGNGLSITVPFKLQAWELVNHRSERATLAGAVNTIIFHSDGSSSGDNTDGIGLVRDLQKTQQFSLQNKRILIAGAGGSVQGILAPLLECRPTSICIVNRRVEKAENLVKQFADLGCLFACGYDQLKGEQFDLIINATSTSLSNELPPLPSDLLLKNAWCYDLAYGDKPTTFQRWAQAEGAEKALDGLGMLVEQAAEQFYLWRGIMPETQPVLNKLRQLINTE